MNRLIAHAAGDGDGDGQIGGRLVNLEAADHVHEDIFIVNADADTTAEHGGQQQESVVVNTVGSSAGIAERGGAGQGLDFDEQRAGPLNRDGDRGTGGVRLPFRQECLRGIGNLNHTPLNHFKNPDLARGAKAVLYTAEEPVAVEGVALQVEHGVDDVLQDAGTGNVTLFGHVPDQEDSDPRVFGQLLELAGTVAHLAHATRGRGQFLRVGRLNAVDDDEHRRNVRNVLQHHV